MYLLLLIVAILIFAIHHYSSKKNEHFSPNMCVGDNCNLDVYTLNTLKRKKKCFITPKKSNSQKKEDEMDAAVEEELKRAAELKKRMAEKLAKEQAKMKHDVNSAKKDANQSMCKSSKLISDMVANHKNGMNNRCFKESLEYNGSTEAKFILDKSVQTQIEDLLDDKIKNSGLTVDTVISDDVRDKINEGIDIYIGNAIRHKKNNNLYGDVSQAILPKDSVIESSVDRIMKTTLSQDKNIKAFTAKCSAQNQLKIGDFVYFRQNVTGEIPEICISGKGEIIAGGRICNIDRTRGEIAISYNFIMNPNTNCKNNTLTALLSNNGPDKRPKWFPQSTIKENKCGNSIEGLGCYPNSWSTLDDKLVNDYVGGFDRSNNRMKCGVGPALYKLPPKISANIVSKNLDKVLNEYKSQTSLFKNCEDFGMEDVFAENLNL